MNQADRIAGGFPPHECHYELTDIEQRCMDLYRNDAYFNAVVHQLLNLMRQGMIDPEKLSLASVLARGLYDTKKDEYSTFDIPEKLEYVS